MANWCLKRITKVLKIPKIPTNLLLMVHLWKTRILKEKNWIARPKFQLFNWWSTQMAKGGRLELMWIIIASRQSLITTLPTIIRLQCWLQTCQAIECGMNSPTACSTLFKTPQKAFHQTKDRIHKKDWINLKLSTTPTRQQKSPN